MKLKNLDDAKELITKITSGYAKEIGASYRVQYSNRMISCKARCTEHRLGVPVKYTFTYSVKYLVKYLDKPKQIENIITHEIAHAIVGIRHHHDSVWKAQHRKMGGNGERLFKEVA